MAKGDQIPMFEPEPGDQRRCTGCGTNYEAIPELHKGGWCPHCGSQRYEPAVPSDYSTSDTPKPEPEPESEGPIPGSTEDYLNE